jgi:hypothetical protein
MLQHKENLGVCHALTLEKHSKCLCLNTNNISVKENVALSLFYNASSTAVFM